jgi:hypothetical protein
MKHPSENKSQEVLAGLVERVTYLEWEHGPGSSEIADSIPDVPWHKYKRTLEPPACARIDEKTFQVWLVFIFSADSRFCIEARARTSGVRHFARTPHVAEVPGSSAHGAVLRSQPICRQTAPQGTGSRRTEFDHSRKSIPSVRSKFDISNLGARQLERRNYSVTLSVVRALTA